MRKLFWGLIITPLVILMLAVGLSGYYIHVLPFQQRVLCAAGEPGFLFLRPACRAYIKSFYSGETPEDREIMSANLGFLISGYDSNEGNAVGERSLALVKLFFSRGADVNYVSQMGTTPLHRAVILENRTAIEFLLRQGADVDKRTAVTFIGETLSPLELAIKTMEQKSGDEGESWQEIVDLLNAYSEDAA